MFGICASKPIWLNAETVTPTAASFRAEEPPYLQVQVTNAGMKSNIEAKY